MESKDLRGTEAGSPVDAALAEALVAEPLVAQKADLGHLGHRTGDIDVGWWPRGVRREDPGVVEIDEYLRLAGAGWWLRNRPGWTEAGWWDSPMLPAVRALLRLPKGPALLAAMQHVPGPDGAGCEFPHPRHGELLVGEPPGRPGNPCPCQVVVIAAWATCASWVADRADRSVIDAFGPTEQREYLNPRRPGLGSIVDPGVELVSPALHRSPDSMRHYVAKVRDRQLYPDSIRAAIAEGFLPGWQADLVLQDLLPLTPEGRDLVVDAVIEAVRERHARGLSGWAFSELRQYAKKMMAALDDALRDQRAAVHQGRRVDIHRGSDGWSRVTADLPTDVAHRIYARLTALAAGLDDDGSEPEARTLDQKRADVLTDLILDASTSSTTSPSGNPGAASTEVSIVIQASTLLRADDRSAELKGCGPIPADVARTLAADSKWRVWLTDAAGVVVATSPTTYSPSAAVARVVRGREPECRMPGCRRTRVDLDHVIPFPRGQTVPDNLASLCRRHHNLKTHRSWDLSDDSDGYLWTDPHGVTHRDHHDPPVPY